MKSILVRSLAVAMLASSISAFAASAPSKAENANDSMESNISVKLNLLEREVRQLEVNDKLNQEKQQKTNEEQKKKIRQQNKQWEESLMGIFG